MKKDSGILIIGHNSLTGRALSRRLRAEGYKKILTIPVEDLVNQNIVERFFKKNSGLYISILFD